MFASACRHLSRARAVPWLSLVAIVLAACAAPTVPGDGPDAQAGVGANQTGRAGGLFGSSSGTVPPFGRAIPPEDDDNLRRVGLLLPLTGPAAARGRDLLDAASMALFDRADESFVLLPRDTRGTAVGARIAAQQVLAEGATLILGPLLASSVAAVAPEARQRGVPVVAFSNDRAVAGNGVFVLGFLPQDQVDRIVRFARSRGLSQFGIVAPQNQYGVAMVDALRIATRSAAGDVTDVTYYHPDGSDMPDVISELARYESRRQALERQRTALAARNDDISRQALERLQERDTLGDVGFEAVLLPAGGDEVLQLAPLLAFYDIDPSRVKLLGTWLWDDPSLRTEPAMVGAWFAAPPPGKRDEFVGRFRTAYGRGPDRLATLGYDAVALAAILAQQVDAIEPFAEDALTAPNGFSGMDGIFRLRPNGVAERGLAVLEIGRDGLVVRDPAPDSFAAFVN